MGVRRSRAETAFHLGLGRRVELRPRYIMKVREDILSGKTDIAQEYTSQGKMRKPASLIQRLPREAHLFFLVPSLAE